MSMRHIFSNLVLSCVSKFDVSVLSWVSDLYVLSCLVSWTILSCRFWDTYEFWVHELFFSVTLLFNSILILKLRVWVCLSISVLTAIRPNLNKFLCTVYFSSCGAFVFGYGGLFMWPHWARLDDKIVRFNDSKMQQPNENDHL